MGSSCLILNISVTVDNITLVPQMLFFSLFVPNERMSLLKLILYTL